PVIIYPRVCAQHLEKGALLLDLLEGLLDGPIVEMPFHIDEKDVVAQTPLGRTRLELGQVDVAIGESLEGAIQVAWPVHGKGKDDGGLIPARRRGKLPAHHDKAGGVIL